MHGNVATPLCLEDQIIENQPMEPSIGVIGNEIAHLRSDVNELKEGMKTVNVVLGELKNGQTQLSGAIATVRAEIGTLRAEMRAEMTTIRAEIRGEMDTIRSETGAETCSIRTEMGALRAEVGILGKQIDARIAGLETKIIKWVIGTGMSCAGLAFTFARLLR